MEIKTERLHLREYTKDCLSYYHKLKSDPIIWKYSTFIPMKSINKVESLLTDLISLRNEGKDGFLSLFEIKNDQFIGEAGIISSNRNANRCEIGYNLLPQFWNQGFATEITIGLVSYAMDTLGYERVEAMVLAENKASCKVMEKSGFKCEGVLRHFNKCEDRYRDVNYYGIISSDIK